MDSRQSILLPPAAARTCAEFNLFSIIRSIIHIYTIYTYAYGNNNIRKESRHLDGMADGLTSSHSRRRALLIATSRKERKQAEKQNHSLADHIG